MGLPAVVLNVQNNGLAQASPGDGNTEYVIGGASQGPYYAIVQSTNPNDFSGQNGSGPGVELAGFICNSTGNEVAFVAVPLTGGANTAIVATVPGGSTSAVTLTGTPQDTYYGRCNVIAGGTIGAVGIQVSVSLDANRTVFNTYNLGTATTLLISQPGNATTGLTLNFGAGTLVAGDSFAWVSTEGTWTDAEVQSAISVMLPIPTLVPQDIIIAGGSAQRNGAATVGIQPGDVTVFDGYATTLFNKKRFNRVLCAAGDAQWGGASGETEAAWMTSLQSSYANAVSPNARVVVTAGHYNFISPYSQTQFRRPGLWGAAARDSAVAIQVDLGRVKDGAIANMPNSPPPKADGFIYHDESVNPGLDAARFLSFLSYANRPGLYIANPNIMSSPGSINLLQYGHVIDGGCLAAYNFFVEELSDSVRVDANGHILAVDQQDLQTRANIALVEALGPAVSSVQVLVSTTDNILLSSTLTVTIQIQPLGYLKVIAVTFTFVNVAAVVIQQS